MYHSESSYYLQWHFSYIDICIYGYLKSSSLYMSIFRYIDTYYIIST